MDNQQSNTTLPTVTQLLTISKNTRSVREKIERESELKKNAEEQQRHGKIQQEFASEVNKQYLECRSVILNQEKLSSMLQSSATSEKNSISLCWVEIHAHEKPADHVSKLLSCVKDRLENDKEVMEVLSELKHGNAYANVHLSVTSGSITHLMGPTPKHLGHIPYLTGSVHLEWSLKPTCRIC